MTRTERLTDATLVCLSIAAIITTGLAVRRSKEVETPSTIEVNEYRTRSSGSVLSGDTMKAPVRIVVFSDFQCPFCRRAIPLLRSASLHWQSKVAIVYKHYPLTQHTAAFDAAVAAGCADEQGRFPAMHDAIFEFQDSVGRKPWDWFAMRASHIDITTFNKCVSQRRSANSIFRDIADGNAIRVSGTPTILVNGKQIVTEPSPQLIDSLISEALQERRSRSALE